MGTGKGTRNETEQTEIISRKSRSDGGFASASINAHPRETRSMFNDQCHFVEGEHARYACEFETSVRLRAGQRLDNENDDPLHLL